MVGKVIEPREAHPTGVSHDGAGSSGVPYADQATTFVTPTQGGVIVTTATTSRLVMTPSAAITSQVLKLPPSPVNGQLFYVSAVASSVSGIRWRGNVVVCTDSIPAAHTTVLQFNATTAQWLCVQQ